MECAIREEKGRRDIVFDGPAKVAKISDGKVGFDAGKGVEEEMGIVEKFTKRVERRKGFGLVGSSVGPKKGKAF